MLSTIFSGLKSIIGLGSSDGFDKVTKVASGIGEFIDEQKFTEEEKAKHNLAISESLDAYLDRTASENTQQSQTRRQMAMAVMATFLFWFNIQLIIHLAGYVEASKFIRDQLLANPFASLVGGVGLLFFATHMVRTAKK